MLPRLARYVRCGGAISSVFRSLMVANCSMVSVCGSWICRRKNMLGLPYIRQPKEDPNEKRERPESVSLLLLGAQAVTVSRKQCCFANIGKSEQLFDESFKSNGQSTMWGHAILEALQIILKRCRVQSSNFHPLN